MQVNLVVAGGKHAGRAIPVDRRKFFIGRASDCKLRPSGSAISRHHCVIVTDGDLVTVRDFGSRTGTFVNDQKIEREEPLNAGDRLRVGKWEFVVEAAVETDAPQKAKPKPAPPSTAKPVVDDDVDLTEWFREASDRPDERADVLGELDRPLAAKEPKEEAPSEAEAPFVRDKSEAEKERRRREGRLVGVSKAAQARRAIATSREGAAEALRKLLSGQPGT